MPACRYRHVSACRPRNTRRPASWKYWRCSSSVSSRAAAFARSTISAYVPDGTITAVRALAEEVLSLIEMRRFKLLETGEWIGTVTASAAIVVAQGEERNALLDTARVKLEGAIAAGGNRVVI